jgi:hypothetical protein
MKSRKKHNKFAIAMDKTLKKNRRENANSWPLEIAQIWVALLTSINIATQRKVASYVFQLGVSYLLSNVNRY